MAGWKQAANWMAFEKLDYGLGLDHAFTLAFKMTDNSGETWSNRFVRFKAKDEAALYGSAKLMKPALPELMKHLGLDPDSTVIVPALSSAEKVANDQRHVPRLAKALAKAAGCRVDMASISKDPHRSLHTIPAADRYAELDKANYAAKRIDAKTVVILDDFITQGATLAITARKLKAANNKLTVLGVALGKTERTAYWEEYHGIKLTNDHVPKGWDSLWREGEQIYEAKKKAGAK